MDEVSVIGIDLAKRSFQLRRPRLGLGRALFIWWFIQ